MYDDDEFTASLAGLSGVLTGHRDLEQTLVRVAEYAVQAVPGAAGAGLTLLEGGRPQTVVASAPFVRAVDDIQYSLDEGPCVSAVEQARTFRSGNLGGEPQWPHFGPRVGRLGVHSALSLPLLLPGRTVGALNVYAHGRDVFSDRARQLGEAFSVPAAVTVSNAQMLAQAERLVAQLEQAITSRAQVDQAVGVLVSRSGITSDEAFARLRALSQARGMKLGEVARELVEQASARARARHGGTDEPA